MNNILYYLVKVCLWFVIVSITSSIGILFLLAMKLILTVLYIYLGLDMVKVLCYIIILVIIAAFIAAIDHTPQYLGDEPTSK